MRAILSEYGLLVCTVIVGTIALALVSYMCTHYKEFSKNFIGCITGAYTDYEEDITLEEIEEGLF